MRKKLHLRILCSLAILFSLFTFVPDSFAELKGKLGGGVGTSDLFKNSGKLVDNTLSNTEAITYGIAALGIIGLGIMAFFGRFQWSWFFTLIAGLVLVAGAAAGIQYITGQDISKSVTGNSVPDIIVGP
jgi:type IV secretory pathway VirB2 component (pilin)